MSMVSARTVGEAMTRGLVTVRAEAKLEVAAQLMDAYHLHGLAVIDDEHRVVGVLSQTDMLRVRSSADWPRLTELEVGSVMTTPALTIASSSSLDDAARLMRARRVHRLVVVGRDGVTPVGVLSVTDLVRGMTGGEDQS